MRRVWMLLGLAALSGCVSQVKYDKLAQDAATAKRESDARIKNDEDEIARLRVSLKNAEDAAQDRDGKIAELSTSSHNLQASLDEATAINQRLRQELERLGKDVDEILKERGTLSHELESAKTRLDELRHAQAAAEARTQLFRDFAHRFQRMIEGKQLAIVAKNGLLVLSVSSDLLFDANKAEIRTAGQGALMEIAHALATGAQGRRFLVGAHTDNAKPTGRKFPSNWELSALRATEIVRFMIAQGVPAPMIAAVGYGDSDPVAPNDSADNRAKNRRVEIALQPNPEDLIVPAEWKP